MKTKEQELKEIQAFCDSIKNAKITYNPELDKREGVSLFPEKVKKAKEVIAKGGLPKEYYEQIARQKEEENEK